MKSNPIISIIMPVQNTEAYLKVCLDSIIDQSYQAWELIAVNDHSTDLSKKILQSYAKQDDRIKTIDNPSSGIIAALVHGHKACSGRFICRMDSDDIMAPTKLNELLGPLLEHGAGHVASCGTVYFSEAFQLGNGYKRYADWINGIVESGDYWSDVYKECVIPSCCWMVHRSDFESIGGFNSNQYPEDYDLCFRFYQAKFQIIGVNRPLHRWRDRADRISRISDIYKDNRFFDLKVDYFLAIDHQESRPLVLWGAGKNGKDLAKRLIHRGIDFHWVCETSSKIGKDIYGIRMKGIDSFPQFKNPQIIVAVSSPKDQQLVRSKLRALSETCALDFCFFL